MGVKRFQKIGVVQPESIIDATSRPAIPSAVPVLLNERLRTLGRIVASEPTQGVVNINDLPIPDSLLINQSNVASQTTSDTPSRQDSTQQLDKQSATTQPWGGRSILAQGQSKQITATVAGEKAKASELLGNISVSPQVVNKSIFQVVVKQPVGVAIHRWGGFAIAPLYWLDTDPSFGAPVGYNKWGATVEPNGTKWTALEHSKHRFTLSVDGGLEWPIVPT